MHSYEKNKKKEQKIEDFKRVTSAVRKSSWVSTGRRRRSESQKIEKKKNIIIVIVKTFTFGNFVK